MQSANEQLAQQAPATPAVSITDLQEDEQPATDHESDQETEQHVQMDIACGVLELKDLAAMRAAEAMLNGAQYTASSECGAASDSECDQSRDGSRSESSDMDSDAIPTAVAAFQHDQKEVHISTSGQPAHADKAGLRAGQNTRKKSNSGQAIQKPSKILEL